MTQTVQPARLPPPPPSLLRDAGLFLDFDGTLVDIVDRPDAVDVGERLRALLAGLHDRLDGRVVILTGRAADDVLAFLDLPEFPVSGHHGAEFRNLSAIEAMVERPHRLDELLASMRTFAARFDGVIVEEKPFGLALHYRQRPDAEDACRTAIRDAAELSGLEVQQGKMVVELKIAGADKGRALERICATDCFAHKTPVFLGDDLTDEPGFEAASRLGGAGILVGDRAHSAATYRVRDPAAAIDWLEAAMKDAR